jgi:hypothetical protein
VRRCGRAVGHELANHGRVKRDANRKVRAARRRVHHSGGDRQIDRHQKRLGGVEALRLVREKHVLRSLGDDTQGKLVH